MQGARQAALYRKFAEVIELCEGTSIRPETCWKMNGVRMDTSPHFNHVHGDYSFIHAIIEGQRIWVGDIVFWKETLERFTVKEYHGVKWLQEFFTTTPF
jgi:hypothetical protein